MLLWQTKSSSSGTYKTMKTPSRYSISWEDLDNGSYRSINTGNMNRNIVSKSWTKLQFEFNYLTREEASEILQAVSKYPIYVKAKNPIFGTDYVEMEMYCSQKSAEMLQTGDYSLSFNLIQKKKVSGQ